MIEVMKQALEYLEESDNYLGSLDHSKPIAALRQAIDAYTLSSRPPGLCMCGEPWRLESVHRKKSPCFDYIEREWVGLTDEEFSDCLVEGDPCEALAEPEAWAVMREVAAKLKEKNT